MLFYVRSSPLPDLLCLSADILASVCAIVWNCQFHSKVVLIVRMKAIRAPLLLFGVHLSCVCVGGEWWYKGYQLLLSMQYHAVYTVYNTRPEAEADAWYLVSNSWPAPIISSSVYAARRPQWMLYNIGLYQPCCCWEFSFASCTKDYSASLVFRRSFIIILLNSCLKQLLLHSRVFIWVSGEPYLDNFGCVTVTWCRVLLEKLSSGLQRTVTE